MARKGATAKSARRALRKRKGLSQVRQKKEFTFRGYVMDELQAMPVDEFADLLPSRQRRSLTRGLTPEKEKLMKTMADPEIERARTHRRDMIVLPSFVNKVVSVYNGRDFVEVRVQPEMIGHYLGEFALTRRIVKHSGPGVGATRSSKFMPLK